MLLLMLLVKMLFMLLVITADPYAADNAVDRALVAPIGVVPVAVAGWIRCCAAVVCCNCSLIAESQLAMPELLRAAIPLLASCVLPPTSDNPGIS
uniref:Putative secreted protein n=1 Tax=Anopheles marajoara TaxID=58244 RepID=A0A2M4CAF4_9DIPT